MIKQMIQYCKGHVRIRVSGGSYDRFLNMCAKHDLYIWDLEYADNAYEMNISIKGFRILRPLARKSHTKVRIIGRYGLPFFVFRYRKRKMLFAGIISGAILMVFLSGFIWDININGNQTLTTDVIINYLESENIIHGMPKASVDCKGLAADLRQQFNDLIWVSVRIEGTRLLIDMQENTDLKLDDKIDYGPSDLVSNVEGTVVKIITRSGVPMVKAGDEVKKDDLLVSGQIEIINDSGEVAGYQYCAADADIYVKTRYLYSQTFSMNYNVKEYSGQLKRGYYLNIFGKKISLIRKKVQFETYDVTTIEQQAKLGDNFYLPVSWGSVDYKEYELIQKTYSKNAAEKRSEDTLNKFLEKIQEKGVQIFENNVKIESDGKTCKASGEVIVIEKVGKRVERTTENEYHRVDSGDSGGT